MLLGCCNFSNKPFVEFNLVKLTNLSYVLECFYYFLSFSHCELTTILLTLEVDLSKKHNVFKKIVILKIILYIFFKIFIAMIKRLTNRHLILSYMLKHDPDILMLPNVHQIYPTLY